ncbi:MAG: hypothetical protein JWM34_360 [Ilumatobacteraceae bacterium]|nr:hypothetical protein [Ilumatobacteraceae bacterium]
MLVVTIEPPRPAIDDCVASHRALQASLSDLTDAQAAAPSLLPGWSVGHVLTHIARNADGLGRIVDGASRGEVAEMYVGGIAAREAEIESGAARSAAELVADVRASNQRIEALFEAVPPSAWDGVGNTVRGPLVAREVPGRRRIEVEVHRVDLGLGYTFADWPPAFLRTELARMTGQWASRKPMGFADLPDAALRLSPADRYAWLMGRMEVEGLPAAGLS